MATDSEIKRSGVYLTDPGSKSSARRTWEYKSVASHWNSIDDEMDALGKEGWELVTLFQVANGDHLFCAQFKREIVYGEQSLAEALEMYKPPGEEG